MTRSSTGRPSRRSPRTSPGSSPRSAPRSAPRSSPTFAASREKIRAGLSDGKLPSVAVGVYRAGEPLWEEAFGWADREKRVPATPHTMYSLASITKPITALGIMVLVERGLIDLDRPINDYLGDAKLTARVGDAADATVRRVMQHTSGLPLHFQFFYEDEPRQRPPMDVTILRYGNLVRAPGERYQYSNLGYGILDYVIERGSGRRYADFIREEIFLPLGMFRSSIDVPPELAPFAALRYGADAVPYAFYTFDHPGGSAAYSSVHDLARLAAFVMGAPLPDQKPILKPETIAAMLTPSPESGGYALGWSTRADFFGHRTIGHDGGMGGVATTLMCLPDDQIVLVALGNGASGTVYELPALLLGDLFPTVEKKRKQREAENKRKEKVKTAADSFRPGPGLAGQWSGEIHTCRKNLPFTLDFQPGGEVHARVDNGLTALVNEVRLQDGNLTGTFLGDLDTEDTRIRRDTLRLDLKARDGVLNGAVISLFQEGPEGGAPARRVRSALAHWAELRRAPNASSAE